MLFVCSRHVRIGVTILDTPHIKQISHGNCSFCKRKAMYNLSNGIPFPSGYLKTIKSRSAHFKEINYT